MDNIIMPKQGIGQANRKNLIIAVVVSLIIGFASGFYVNQAEVIKLQNKLAPFEAKEAAREEAVKNLSTSSGGVSDEALNQAIKNLSQ